MYSYNSPKKNNNNLKKIENNLNNKGRGEPKKKFN